jgi:diaminopimelate decarboxylase
MSLRKMSAIVPEAMHEITRLIDARERQERQASVQAGKTCIAGDLVAENRPVDPRKRVGRAGRVREGRQLELELQQTIRIN